MPLDPSTFDSGNAAWVLMSASLVLLMTPALAMFYGGMSRQKAVLNMMMMSFGALGVVTVVYVLWGWSMSYGDSALGGLVGNPFQFFGLRNTLTDADGAYLTGAHGYPVVIDVAFQVTFAIIAVALISGAIAERVKYGTWLVFCALWSTFVFFPLAHMIWGGGLLAHPILGRAPIDFAGGTVVHISAGTAALTLALMVGARGDFMKVPARPHNLPMVMLGAALLWFGWCGFNAGSALTAGGLAGMAWLATTCAGAAGILGWLLVERLRDGQPTSLGAASGAVAGLVAITPAAGVLNPVQSIVLGAIAGGLCAVGIGLKYRFRFDDSLDVVGVHLLAGLWGTIGLAFFHGGFRQFVAQLVVALAAMVFTAVMTAGIAALLAHMGWRIDREAEFDGIDVHEHKETAYEVAVHSLGTIQQKHESEE